MVLSLLYDRDMDPAEVAQHLGVDVQTIRSTHHKALTRLRQHFRENAGE
jgi:RNA polymerase sigma-70 factor (ECF subfamily)